MSASTINSYMLLSKIGRTKIESKSQLKHIADDLTLSCYQRSEEQRLKANHNSVSAVMNQINVVINDRKNKD